MIWQWYGDDSDYDDDIGNKYNSNDNDDDGHDEDDDEDDIDYSCTCDDVVPSSLSVFSCLDTWGRVRIRRKGKLHLLWRWYFADILIIESIHFGVFSLSQISE